MQKTIPVLDMKSTPINFNISQKVITIKYTCITRNFCGKKTSVYRSLSADTHDFLLNLNQHLSAYKLNQTVFSPPSHTGHS